MRLDKMKKLFMLTVVGTIISLGVTGCGGEEPKDDSDMNKEASSVNITREEYIGLLGTELGYDEYISEEPLYSDVNSSDTYYAQIQACSEWDILEDADIFNPDDEASLEFALKTAVKALGIENADEENVIEESELVSFYIDNIYDFDTSDLDGAVDKKTATEIVQYAAEYRNEMEFSQHYEYELTGDVKTANGDIFLNYDGTTGFIAGEADYKVGDIVYWEGSETSGPMAARIKSIDNGTFTYEVPNIDEVYSSLDISGTYDGKVLDATSASDGTNVEFGKQLYDEVKNYGVSYNSNDTYVQPLGSNVKVDKGKDYVRFTANADMKTKGENSSAKATGSLVAEIKNIKVTIDYDKSHGLKPQHVSAKLTFDTNVSSTITGEFSKSIPLGEVWISVAGPVQLRLVLTANIGANGEVSIAYTTDNALTIGYKKDKGLQKSFDCEPKLDFDAEATVTAEVTALADLVVGFNFLWSKVSESIVNAEFTTGMVAIAKTDGDLLSDEPMCTDVLIYVPLRWGINQESCLLTSISSKLKYKQTVWDSENSKIKMHLHYEDSVRTDGDKCTRGEEEKVVQEETNEYGDPFDELEIFEFEEIDFDFIRLESNLIMLNEGESKGITITSIPDGYSQSDIIYEVTDANVCSVVSGNVIAKKAGSTIVKVKTSDGTYSTSIAVTVFEDFSIEDFKPL